MVDHWDEGRDEEVHEGRVELGSLDTLLEEQVYQVAAHRSLLPVQRNAGAATEIFRVSDV